MYETKYCSCFRSYHVYQEDWLLVRGETFQCFREVVNAHVLYAVKVLKTGTIGGNLPCTVKKQGTAMAKLYIIRIVSEITKYAPLAACSYNA